MKPFLLLSVLLMLVCCKQQQDSKGPWPPTGKKGLVGKWLAREQYTSNGSGGIWKPIPANQRFTVEFNADSSFNYSPSFPKADSGFAYFSTFDTQVRMRNAAATKHDIWLYTPEPGDTLHLSVFICFEGCAYRLQRVN
jgi:hypothetical protein